MGAWLALWKVLHYFTAGLGWPGWDQLGLPYLSRRSWPPVTTSRLSNSAPVIGGPVTPVSAVTRSGTCLLCPTKSTIPPDGYARIAVRIAAR
jgi:hypothetical protein